MRILPTLVLLFLPVAASADEVLLENGGRLEGRARCLGDEVIVTTPRGEIRLKASEVKSIAVGRTAHDDYAERLKALDEKSAAAHAALGDWCRQNGLGAEARRHFGRAIEIEPDHADARKALGFLRHEDRWLTLDEYFRARGFVKVEGEWVEEEEARRRDAGRREREAFARHQKTIRDAVVKMSSMKRKTRAAAKLALQEYAEETGDLKLATFASDVAAYYNASWREVKRALVLVEVRATWAQLKRPIPTFSTSLGAFSTPVTIQLPELSVVSVKTTALVPAEIELDEEE